MGPRLFGIPASDASIVAVVRRGPSAWAQLGCWDTDALTYEPGPWLRGRVYPQRCDLSPDGAWFVALVLKGSARWSVGPTYVAVSRLPALEAQAAWPTDGTWSRGLHFVPDLGAWSPGPPDAGDDGPLRGRYGLQPTWTLTFAVERRRGWSEMRDTPPRSDDDPWEERRATRVTMEKTRPGEPETRLAVSGRFAAFREMDPVDGPPRYRTVTGDGDHELSGVQWADWDRRGRLLVATAGGRLEIRDAPHGGSAAWSLDLASERPPGPKDPGPPG